MQHGYEEEVDIAEQSKRECHTEILQLQGKLKHCMCCHMNVQNRCQLWKESKDGEEVDSGQVGM